MPITSEAAVQKTKDAANKLANFAGKGTIALFIVIALMLIVIIVVYIVYRIKASDLQNVVIVKNSMRLYNMKQTYRFDAAKLPPTLNGQEYSFSFWLYLVEYPPMENHALIFCRGGAGQSVDKSNPIVYLDKRTNRLHIAVKTTSPVVSPLVADTQGNSILDNVSSASGHMKTTIDYVPLQRWVHVTFTVQDNLLTSYLDGDIYTVSNIFDMPRTGGVRPVFAGTNGDVYVGALPNVNSQAKAFVAKMQFFNFAVMHKDVKTLYAEGPSVVTGMMSRIGLAEYGVRTPVYRIEA
jgi:Concanavalin A-like lectin/glucanases superfamily